MRQATQNQISIKYCCFGLYYSFNPPPGSKCVIPFHTRLVFLSGFQPM